MDITHITTVTNDLLNWVVTKVPWDLVIASGILSPVLLFIKKKLGLQSSKVISSLVLLLSGISATAIYLLTTTSADPSIIAVHTFVIAAMSQPWYHLALRPAYSWLEAELAKAAAFDAEVKSAAIPANGIPPATQS